MARLGLLLLIAGAVQAAQPLRVGVAGSPPFVIQGAGAPTGLSVELWQDVAARNGLKYQLVAAASVPALLEAVRAGQVDVGVGPSASPRSATSSTTSPSRTSPPPSASSRPTSEQLAHHYTHRVLEAPDRDAAARRVLDGEADAVLFDLPQLAHYLAQHPSAPLRLIDSGMEPQTYGFALPIGSALRKPLSVTLLKLLETGRVRALADRWIGADDSK